MSASTSSPPPLDEYLHAFAVPGRLSTLFNPQSLAIVGGSEKSFWAQNFFRNLERQGFTGTVVPVHPSRTSVFGRTCYASLRDLPNPVDLAYVLAPTEAVPQVLSDAEAGSVGNVVVVAAGFSEIGEHGANLQAGIVEQACRGGIAMLGPNCPGFLNIPGSVSAYGQEIPEGLKAGGVAVLLQSGALTSGVLKFSLAHGIGLSTVVCMGNEAVVRSADVLAHLVADPSTRAIAMFLEEIRDGRSFLRLAEQAIAAGKAVIVLKVGRTLAGQRSALAHTGALAGDAAVTEAALRQVGVVMVRSLEEMLLTAALLASGPRLTGRRMGVVTSSGGSCDIIADRASDEGLELPPLSEETATKIRDYLPSFATVQNPLDTAAVDTMQTTGTAASPMDVVAEIVSQDPNFDFILYMGFNMVPFSEPSASEAATVAARIDLFGETIKKSPVPILGMSQTCMDAGPFARQLYDSNDILLLGGMEFGLAAIGHAVRWDQARTELLSTSPGPETPGVSVASIGAQELTCGILSEAAGRQLLEHAGVPMVPAELVQSADDAVTAAEWLGYPAVLKICSAQLPHKSDVGGVALNLRDAGEVRAVFERMQTISQKVPEAVIDGVLVSPMRPSGTELFVGLSRDASFGPTLALGLGGVWIEALKDVAIRVLPVDRNQIVAMLRSLKGRTVLEGGRGGDPVDLEAVADVVWRIATVGASLGSRLESLEVNPLWCQGATVEAMDVLVEINPISN
ncbi:MAG: acetate--CoA ligase family protein [Proteobacteria bacterium]|nr:acetate--CoA ligase family protein [Pseudomonadota bacterium]